jgi:hypothetical protein
MSTKGVKMAPIGKPIRRIRVEPLPEPRREREVPTPAPRREPDKPKRERVPA